MILHNDELRASYGSLIFASVVKRGRFW